MTRTCEPKCQQERDKQKYYTMKKLTEDKKKRQTEQERTSVLLQKKASGGLSRSGVDAVGMISYCCC
jgi:hypothetical protein